MLFPSSIKEWCEVKPQNTNSTKKKLNGGGSFNDYTRERFEKDLKQDPTILTSGFVEGKIIFIFEFKFDCIRKKLEDVLSRRFPNKCSSLRLAFLRENWKDYKNYLSKELINFFEKW